MTSLKRSKADADVDVVIVTFNSATDVAESVAAVRRWPRVAKVIVVDNASTDGSAEVADACADVVVRLPANVGFGSAQNVGVAQTAAPFVLALNPDARVAPEGLETGRDLMLAEPAVAAVQGSIVRSEDGREERWQGSEPTLADLAARLLRLRQRLGEERLARLAKRLGAGYFSDRSVQSRHDVEFIAAVAPLLRRRALDDVGGFDRSYFLYAEDVDLCRRLRDKRWRVVAVPGPWATHDGGASSEGARARQSWLWWESHRLLVSRHWKGPRRWAGLALSNAGRRLAARTEMGEPCPSH
ncbi:MAG: glycosyltransferase family 2 protein [Acidimicrobiales bacterium]